MLGEQAEGQSWLEAERSRSWEMTVDNLLMLAESPWGQARAGHWTGTRDVIQQTAMENTQGWVGRCPQ